MPTPLILPDWPLPDGVRIALTTRQGGLSDAPFDSFNLATHVGDQRRTVIENRQRLLQSLTGVRQIQWLEQVHGTDCVRACGSQVVPVADACYTQEQELACAVLTADCLPVLFAAEDGSQVAAAHAGWRGLAGGVLLETLRQFPDASHVRAYCGVGIGTAAFEVGDDVRLAFPEAPACFESIGGGKWLADLAGLASWQLLSAGVKAVFDSGLCSYTDADRFYSFRRSSHQGNPACGRQASLIWITGRS